MPPFRFILPSLLAFLLVSVCPLVSAASVKEDALAKYGRVVALAEELNVYREDIMDVIPKIELAGKALLENNFEQADRVMDEALIDLAFIESRRPTELQKAVKLEWLELYREVIQKYAILALLAYLFVRLPYFRRMLLAERLTPMGKIYLLLLISSASIFFSFFDLSRYGESAWAFLDVQVVFLGIMGMIGGFWPGLLCGIVVGVFRLILKPEALVYFYVAVGCGVAAGVFSTRIKSFTAMGKTALLGGLLIGAAHGVAVYLPLAKYLPPMFVAASIAFLAFSEGFAIFLFLAVVSGVLRDVRQREREKEYLKTRFLFLQAQINPHFLYNALNTISAVCNREKAEGAQKLVLRLSDFYRRALKRADEKVTFREEIAYIDSYLEIEKARYQNLLTIKKDLNLSEELWNVRIPILILQPLIENAIKHGIRKREEGGTLTIRGFEEEGALMVEVIDDGAGMPPRILHGLFRKKEEPADDAESTGLGVQNIHERLQLLYGAAYGLQYKSEPDKGTTVTVRIPVGNGKGK